MDSHEDGGTYVLGGTNQACLNITYNYSKFFYDTLDAEKGLRFLNGMTAENVTPLLEVSVLALGTERDNDYWKATEGNAGYALSILLKWAKQHPRGIFEVT